MSRFHVVCHDCPRECLFVVEQTAQRLVSLHEIRTDHAVEYAAVA